VGLVNLRAKRTAFLLAGLANPSKRKKRLPRQIFPTLLEKDYGDAVIRILQAQRSLYSRLIAALPGLVTTRPSFDSRNDGVTGTKITAMITDIKKRLSTVTQDAQLERLAKNFARKVSEYNRVQLARQAQAALGADVFLTDAHLGGVIESFADANVGLVKDIGDDVARRVEASVLRGVQDGTRHEDIAKQIVDNFDIGEKRAKLIARDQVGKLYGQINSTRQRELGAEAFIWRTSNDERVRPDHAKREGVKYSYAAPPDGELPGEPVNCRCTAEPDFSAILDNI
jgi:SPP1 gp7 family putative phage head morphogenesis protein